MNNTQVDTLVSGINAPGCLLVFKKISTQDMLIPATSFIYFWNFFHPSHLFQTIVFLFGNIKSIKNFTLITAIKTSYFVFSLIYSFLISQTIKFEILRLPFLYQNNKIGNLSIQNSVFELIRCLMSELLIS